MSTEARVLRRVVMPIAGVALTLAAALGLYAFVALVERVAATAQPAPRLWLDYGLVAVSLACALFAGLSLLWSWRTRRQRNVIPGPALYLLGLCVLTLSVQALLVAGTWWGIAGIVAGAAILIAEYRSDWL